MRRRLGARLLDNYQSVESNGEDSFVWSQRWPKCLAEEAGDLGQAKDLSPSSSLALSLSHIFLVPFVAIVLQRP